MQLPFLSLFAFASAVLAASQPSCRGGEKALLTQHVRHPLEFCHSYNAMYVRIHSLANIGWFAVKSLHMPSTCHIVFLASSLACSPPKLRADSASHRPDSPFPSLRPKRLRRLCKCVIKAAGPYKQSVRAATHKNARRCNAKDVALLRKEYPNALAFSKWYLAQ